MNQIEASDLKSLLDRQAVKVLDASWALDGSDMYARYLQAHIPTAHFFDLDAISDHGSDLPHMAPSPEMFADAVGRMGISREDAVVIYDQQGLFSAARVWWTFRLMGHDRVQILRGGLPAWTAENFPVSEELPVVEPAIYHAELRKDLIADRETVKSALEDEQVGIVDARPRARFNGQASEPRAGLRSGHMPGSRSLPFSDVLRDGALKPVAELEAIFHSLGLSGKPRIITTCGSGVTAAIISLALAETGRESQLYDGAWAEWGRAESMMPVVTA